MCLQASYKKKYEFCFVSLKSMKKEVGSRVPDPEADPDPLVRRYGSGSKCHLTLSFLIILVNLVNLFLG